MLQGTFQDGDITCNFFTTKKQYISVVNTDMPQEIQADRIIMRHEQFAFAL